MYHDAKALGPLDEPFLGSGRSSDSLPEVATGRPPKQPGQQTKAELSVRWWVLVLASFVLFGNYYCYDNPAALYTQLRSAFGDGDADFALDFGMLYSVYSLPNVVLPLIGGVLVDRVGVRFSLFLFSLLVLAGQIVCVLGAAAGSLPLLLLGRAIFGLGGESISVAQNAIVTEWFSGAELAMALGANLSIGRVGSVVNNCVSPYIAHRASLTSAFGFGVVLCAGSFLCALALNVVDSRAEQRLRREARRARRRHRELHGASAPAPSAEAGWAGVIDGRADLGARSEPREGLVTPPRGRAEGEGEAGGAPGGTTPRFSRQFWLLMVCCVVSYCCVLPFNNVASAVLQAREYFPFGTRWREGGHRKFVYTPATPEPTDVKCATAFGRHLPFCREQERAQQRAALVMSEPFLVSAALAPLLGHLVDKHGGKGYLIVLSAAAMTSAHVALGLTDIDAAPLLLGLGLGYAAFAAVIWPAIPDLIQPHMLGTAYGVATALQNLGLFLTPVAVGILARPSAGAAPDANPYVAAEMLFASLGGLGVLAGLVLLADPYARRVLNRRADAG